MIIKTLIPFTFLLLVSFHALTQNPETEVDNYSGLEKIIFDRNTTSNKFIHIKKAIQDQSYDQIGWVERINEKKFGFPSFEKKIIEDIYRKIDLQKTDTVLNSTKLYYSITGDIVENFFSGEDQSNIIQQIKETKIVNWDPSKYNYNFSDTASAIKISEPYFSKDHTKAIVFVISPYMERAEFYRKFQGRWEFYFSSLLWIE